MSINIIMAKLLGSKAEQNISIYWTSFEIIMLNDEVNKPADEIYMPVEQRRRNPVMNAILPSPFF